MTYEKKIISLESALILVLYLWKISYSCAGKTKFNKKCNYNAFILMYWPEFKLKSDAYFSLFSRTTWTGEFRFLRVAPRGSVLWLLSILLWIGLKTLIRFVWSGIFTWITNWFYNFAGNFSRNLTRQHFLFTFVRN